jgi:hypothetical protein
VRWKRWLSKLHRFTWLLAVTFLTLFLADSLIGLRTLSLRIACGVTLTLALALVVVDWIASWLVRIDLVGLAHLLEKRYPELAERLVTLVQVEADKTPSRLMPLLHSETAQKLAGVDPREACPLRRERRAWAVTTVLLASLFVGLGFSSAFGAFTGRFFRAWTTPLVPYEIKVIHGNGYALRGGTCSVSATYRMLDQYADPPTVFTLMCEDETGAPTTIAMKPAPDGRFAATLENLRQPLRCQVKADEAVSAAFEVRLIDSPVFSARPSVIVLPPKYLLKSSPVQELVLDETNPRRIEILQYSQMYYHLPLDREPVKASLRVTRLPASESESALEASYAVQWKGSAGAALSIAATSGTYEAELVLELEHGLRTTLPLRSWTVRADEAPRFTQPLRLQGGELALLSSREYRIAPGDALKLHTVVEDNEGLDAVAIEIRVNDEAPRLEKWLKADGKKKLIINDWLPLPSTLKEADRVQFRLHASDNRRLKKGDVQSQGVVLPNDDLLPQVTIAPGAIAGEEAWITLRVDRSAEGFLKQQAEAQADEVRDVSAKIKQKLTNEIEQVQQLQRPIHQQFALTPAQMKEAEKLRALNREIEEDLLGAGQRFLANPELAKLAEHFLEIAEIDMKKSVEALERFSAKDRPLPEAEKELQTSQDALLQARKKLDRMMDWNKLLAQDRLDQFQIEKLLKRQNELADRLKKLRDEEPKSDEEMAKQIEAIRQEQARIAEQTAELQQKSRLVQESLSALQQMRVQRLAEQAERLLADWMKAAGGHGFDPLREKTEKLAADLLDLSQKGSGPEAKAMAKESAHAVEQAKKAMEASQTLKAKGDVAEAKKMDENAAKQLELAVQQLSKLAQAQEMKGMKDPAQDNNPKTAEALQEGAKEMRKAEETLPTTPKDAQAAMKSAANRLAEAAQAASKQSASKLPKAARNSAARLSMPSAGAFPSSVPRNANLEPSLGRAWGDLPGELKTRMLQDVGARFGEEYAQMIRQYFESLAETPTMRRKE